MSLQARESYPIPEETARVARAIFPKGNPVMRLYDEFGPLFHDRDFADRFPVRGQPAEAPTRLARVTLLPFMEGLTDRQAADAVRTRIDWKCLLGLERSDPGFDHTVLSEFRLRLLDPQAEARRFAAVLDLARTRGLLRAGGRQRSGSTHVLSAVHAMTRLEGVTETWRAALNALATAAPDWLRAHTTAAWVDRYGRRATDFRLPRSQAKRQAWVQPTGADGLALRQAVFAEATLPELRRLPAVEPLRRVWVQTFMVQDEQLRWRENDNIPAAGQYISSPYAPDAHYANQRSPQWIGYKVHLTETCEADGPNLITPVETTAAPVADDAVTASIHAGLAEDHVRPAQHVADTGHVNSKLLVESRRDYGLDRMGPTRADTHWQAKTGTGCAASDFVMDWAAHQATCPAGKTSASWTPAIDRFKTAVIKIKFASADGRACPRSARCTRSKPPRRTITIRPQAQHEALRAGRQRELTEPFAELYAVRAGVEGTIAQGVRTHGLRRSRYIGQARTHLQHLMTAAAVNLVRLLHWLAGEPKAVTPRSAFACLFPAAA